MPATGCARRSRLRSARPAEEPPTARPASNGAASGRKWRSGERRRGAFGGRLRRAALALAGFALAGCAVHSFTGVPLEAGAAPPGLQALARRAQRGDKSAQFELGIRYETGDGVPVDLRRARRLYRAASMETGGITYVYVPPVGRETRGSVMPVSLGPIEPGLPEARRRLEALEERSPPDDRR